MDILMYFIGQIFCQVIANENLETNSCLQISVVPTAIHCKDCEIWIKACWTLRSLLQWFIIVTK